MLHLFSIAYSRKPFTNLLSFVMVAVTDGVQREDKHYPKAKHGYSRIGRMVAMVGEDWTKSQITKLTIGMPCLVAQSPTLTLFWVARRREIGNV